MVLHVSSRHIARLVQKHQILLRWRPKLSPKRSPEVLVSVLLCCYAILPFLSIALPDQVTDIKTLLDFRHNRSFWPWLVAPSTSTSSTNQILFKMSNWQLREWLQNQPRFRNPLGWRIWNAAVSVVAWLFSVFSKHLSHAWGEWGEYMMSFTESWDTVSCKWLIESYRIIIESSKNHPKISCFSCTIFWFQEIRRFGVRLSEKSPASPAPWPKAHWSVAASLELLAPSAPQGDHYAKSWEMTTFTNQ